MEETYQLSNPIFGVVVVLVTFALFYVVSYVSNRKQSTVGDLYIAGGKVGAFTNGLAMSSSYMSLATFLGITALILELQMPLIILWIQLIVAIPLITIIYGTSLRRMGVTSPTHFIRERYGVKACIIAAVFMIIVSIMYALGQMIGVAAAFETLLGVPYIAGLFVGGLIIVGYITIGGMSGATTNAAIQMVIIALMFILPLGAIMKALGGDGWFFPPLLYSDMVPAMLEAFPSFFDYEFPTKWFIALIPAITIGALGLPHLAMRVYTSSSLRSARSAMVWYAFVTGLVFSATYAMGFVGVYATETQGLFIEAGDADRLTMILNIVYNPEWVAALVIAGAIAAGVSTLSGNLLSIGALLSQDIIATLKPELTERAKVRMGYLAIFLGGVASILLGINPPEFLTISIFWAFGLAGVTIAPLIIMGVWWKETNRYGAIAASSIGGVVYILLSPFVAPSLVLTDHGVTNEMGISGAMFAVPLSFIILIVVSYVTNRMPSLSEKLTTKVDHELVERIHGWKDVQAYRYNSKLGPVIALALSFAVGIWALFPWGM
ncbi:sodium:solute symporter [Salicibibacter cibi]|uniref:Sodium:solute symporter n=1 Tax=Salicibibacter cibi TaxID=2743001 RepID=A0A7T6Z8X8_9BACI|nr:sodium:solute symporter [Salicibibacter cibi]QQK79095.1 sodium:solute symporter [Salicibibacter cibi]